MYTNILDEHQKNLLSFISLFQKDFFLVGGTAIALYLGHRKSIDFDLFTSGSIDTIRITRQVIRSGLQIEHTLVDTEDEFTIIIQGVKLTFLSFPFEIEASHPLIPDIIRSPDLMTLASMKAYAIGRRSKWKDYVDMYYLLQNGYTISDISRKAVSIFHGAFEEKLFREQLCYYADIDYTERVEYTEADSPSDDMIKDFLTKKATEIH